MDIWLMFLKQMGVQTLNFAFIGRWVGHVFHGKFAHDSIGKAPRIEGELLFGWLTHYAVGVAFSGLLVGLFGIAWTKNPSWGPAMLIGVSTVLIPFLVMQPAMGLGIAASKAATPIRSCVRSMINHAVFGLGLFLSASFIEWIWR
jgi:hypothetical protein